MSSMIRLDVFSVNFAGLWRCGLVSSVCCFFFGWGMVWECVGCFGSVCVGVSLYGGVHYIKGNIQLKCFHC